MARILFALVLAAGIVAAHAGGDEGKAAIIRDALAAGQPIVLAIAAEFPAADGEGETYADWAAYLNAFAEAHSRFAIMAVDGAEAAELLTAPPPLADGYATVFARNADSAVIYEGPILESFVYDAAAAYLDAPADGQFDPELFEPYALKLK